MQWRLNSTQTPLLHLTEQKKKQTNRVLGYVVPVEAYFTGGIKLAYFECFNNNSVKSRFDRKNLKNLKNRIIPPSSDLVAKNAKTSWAFGKSEEKNYNQIRNQRQLKKIKIVDNMFI